MSRMTQRTLPKPEMSLRRNRSLAAVMNSQNQRMNMNTAKASATKLANGEAPKENMAFHQWRCWTTTYCRSGGLEGIGGASRDWFRRPNPLQARTRAMRQWHFRSAPYPAYGTLYHWLSGRMSWSRRHFLLSRCRYSSSSRAGAIGIGPLSKSNRRALPLTDFWQRVPAGASRG